MFTEINVRLSYVLCIGERMFFKEEDRTDRPKKGDAFSFFHIGFFCRNKNRDPEPGEPVIGEIDANRHSPVHRATDRLLMEGFRELSDDEKEKVIDQYAPNLKSVAVSA